MRQSLSERTPSFLAPRASLPISGVVLALVAASVPALAGLVDQVGGRALMDHATEVYAARGKEPSAGLMYGLLYTIAGIEIALWLLVLRSARAGGRWSWLYAAVVVLVGFGMAAALLGAQEYGEQIFPPMWGILALLSPVAGVAALVQLRPVRRGSLGRRRRCQP